MADPLISSILCDFSTSETGKVSQFSAASEETVKKKSLSSQQKDTRLHFISYQFMFLMHEHYFNVDIFAVAEAMS